MALSISVLLSFKKKLRVLVSVLNDTKKISTFLRTCSHPSIEKCSQVLCCTISAILCVLFLFLSKEGIFALL